MNQFRVKVQWSENESYSVVSNSLRPYGLYSPWNSPGQNSEVGSLSLLQGILPTQGSNPGLQHCRRILYQLSQREAQENWSGLPIPSLADPPNPGIESGNPALQVDSLPTELCVSMQGDPGSILGSESSPGEGNDYPLQYSCLENSMDREAWRDYSPWSPKESNTTEWLTLSLRQISFDHLI